MKIVGLPRSVTRWFALAVLFLGGGSTALRAQAGVGTISGTTRDSASGQPVAAVQVNVVGTTNGALSNAEGQFTIRGVQPGQITLRALRVGYSETRQTVAVVAGQTANVNLTLRTVPVSLSAVVSTATGDRRRVEVGNAIAQIDAAEITQTRAVTNVADLLTSRAAGVMVVPGTQTGAGVRVRVRGTSSISLSNNPIYIIDGIRVTGATGSSTVSVGGTTPSRVGDLNPEEIESIEVVRGPSASTLYGTDAANGVIVITTKRGIAGRPQWTYYTEQTALTDRNTYPTAYRAWRTGTTGTTNSTAANTVQCFLSQQATNACKADSITSFNLHEDAETTPFGTGYRQQHGIQVKGGTDAVRYFMHAEFEDEDGVTQVPVFERNYMAARGLSLLPEQESPNRLIRKSFRANMNIALTQKADMTVSTGFTSQDLRLPQSDDSGTFGIAANTYGGPGMKYNLSPAGDTLFGWRQFTPRDIFQVQTNQAIERFTTSASTNYRPTDWLAIRGTGGLDYTQRTDTQLCRFQNCPDIGINRQGFKTDNRTNFYVYTFDANATATKAVSSSIESKTSVGVQVIRDILERNGATGQTLPPGAVTVTAGATKFADEATTESRTVGGYIEQTLAFNDRLFLTGAVRSDRNSAFGTNFKTVFYPKLAASWVASDEPFMDFLPSFTDQLRFRAAYGASGVQPGNLDGVPYYSVTTALGESGELPAVVFTTLGNANLRPERSTELEAGIDVTLFGGRINSELTYYNKLSKDALISRVLPPSLGTGATARLENLGSVRNKGYELLVNATIVQRQAFGWDVSLNGSHNDNKLESLGGQPTIGATQQQREGYPLSGWWSRALTGWDDKNGNSIIEYSTNAALSEITVTDTSIFLGYAIPRTELAFTNGVDLMNRRVRLTAMVDYKGGHKVYNNSERIRCASRFNCQALVDPEASLEEQARVVMVREHPSRSVAGYFEDGDFIRLRELALTYQLPQEWASRLFRGTSMTATLSARNLGILWTKFSGVDPEAFGTTGDAPSSFQAFAPPTYFALRFNFGF